MADSANDGHGNANGHGHDTRGRGNVGAVIGAHRLLNAPSSSGPIYASGSSITCRPGLTFSTTCTAPDGHVIVSVMGPS